MYGPVQISVKISVVAGLFFLFFYEKRKKVQTLLHISVLMRVSRPEYQPFWPASSPRRSPWHIWDMLSLLFSLKKQGI